MKGSQEAYAGIYQRYFFFLLDYGKKICNDRELVCDTIQDLFIELWNNRARLSDTSSIRFYLSKALKYKLYRALAKEPFAQLDDEAVAVELLWEAYQIQEEVSQAQRRRIHYTTAYGETKQLTLPDGTRVILNANSNLSYANDWASGEVSRTRSVRLAGEAFFKVTKRQTPTGSPVKFVVNSRDLQIAVLGTEFNVNQRGQAVSVMLNEGKVQIYNPAKTVDVTMGPDPVN